MPVPWVQIVRLMPTILDVSRELLKRSRRTPVSAGAVEQGGDGAPGGSTLEARVSALEENERRQAELVTTMADQLAQLTSALTVLHGQVRYLIVGQITTGIIAVVALVLALR